MQAFYLQGCLDYNNRWSTNSNYFRQLLWQCKRQTSLVLRWLSPTSLTELLATQNAGLISMSMPAGITTDRQTTTKNLCLFLDGMAKKHYKLRVLLHKHKSWQKWWDNFLSSFGDKLKAWDRAIAYKYKEGTAMPYYFKKRILLLVSDSKLSLVPLIIHGMTKDQMGAYILA